MKTYLIKWLNDDGVYEIADIDTYDAETPLDALHQFTKARSEDLTMTAVRIVNDDPDNYVLYLEGYVENKADMRFDVVGDEFEYIAVEAE